jgi:hypothetical protein
MPSVPSLPTALLASMITRSCAPWERERMRPFTSCERKTRHTYMLSKLSTSTARPADRSLAARSLMSSILSLSLAEATSFFRFMHASTILSIGTSSRYAQRIFTPRPFQTHDWNRSTSLEVICKICMQRNHFPRKQYDSI